MAGNRGLPTRDRIIEACAALLRRGGPEAASQRAICDMAGVKAPTLYYHFGDLGRLHQLAVERAYGIAAARKRTGAALPALEKLRQGWDAYLAFARDEPGVFAALARQIVADTLPTAAQASYTSLVEDVRALEAEGAKLTCDPETAAQMLWAAAHGVACLTLAASHGFFVDPALSTTLREATLSALTM